MGNRTLKPFKSNEAALVTNWDEEIIGILLPCEVSLFTKKWTADYRIKIEGVANKVTQEGVERTIYGSIPILSISKAVLAKINIIVGKEPCLNHTGTTSVGNFYFNGHINPDNNSMNYLPHLEFNLSVDREIWEGMRETLQYIHEKSHLNPEISIRVDYENKPDAKNFVEEGCSDSRNVTYFWLESVKSVDQKMLIRNTAFISDFQK